jgi:cytoskeletal protein CcmA (bactofilin family)
MWSKQQSVAEPPVSTPSSPSSSPSGFGAPSTSPLKGSNARNPARIGSSIEIRGHLIGSEDLQIDGKVEGPISLDGHELTVGPTAVLHSEIQAGEITVSGKVVGNVFARGRVEIRKDGSIIGDISSARISIEDGAHFKGRIEIDPTKSQNAAAD